jgi:hypothetical protein
MTKRIVVLGILLLAAVAPAAEAQRSQRGSRAIELGIDGGIFFGLDDPNATVVSLPVQAFRIGFPMTPKLALEPRAALNSFRAGGGSVTNYMLELGVVYSPNGDRVGRGLYGRPFVGVSGRSSSGPGDDSDAHLGLGVGLKIPFADRRLATRLEANYAHQFSDPGTNQIGVLIGLSFFTR